MRARLISDLAAMVRQSGQVDLAHKGGRITLDTARILGMVDTVEQRLDSVR